ncbi:MAG: orotate phosphoribosyltransferase [Spirochaetes bacterium]|nr:orotate phosphoribosyltransferase [Spirochaetota bacterium]
MKDYKQEFIEFMVESSVLTFGDFTTKSGRKTPFFINTGNFKTGKQLHRLGEYYARAINENFGSEVNILFGPAYKGIPLSVAASISLFELFGYDVSYCSNRKEVKDHGDTGILLGAKPVSGDKIVIIEDVTTAGTSIYETMPVISSNAEVSVLGLIISVDRMEKGLGEKSAFDELKEKYGFKTCSIVNMKEITEYLHNREINGRIVIDDKIMEAIGIYYQKYGA